MRKLLIYIIQVLILFTAYFTTARFGLTLDAVSGFATLVWPPTGISLAALLISRFGYKLWPGIFLAAFLVNSYVGASLTVAIAIGIGNTLSPVIGSIIFKKIAQFNNLERLKCALALIFTALSSTLISSTIGTTSLLISKTISSTAYSATWWAWWVGDSLGILLVGSLLLIDWKEILKTKLNYLTLLHFFAIELFLILSSISAFWGIINSLSIVVFYFILSPLIWAALRFGQPGGVIAVTSMTLIALWGVVHGYGPFAHGPLSQNLLTIQLFMGSVAINILILGAVVSERREAKKELDIFNKHLEDMVTERTKELTYSENRYRSLAYDLEGQVADRTQKLSEKVADLEKLNKFMVGRELKMTELKNQIDELKKKLESDSGKK